MLLIEEAFDVWHSPKEPRDFSVRFKDHWHDAVRAMVLSARNCASVIMWSIGNEIPYRATDEGVEWEWKLANTVRQLDPTRPVTAGLNGVLGGPMIAKEGTARRGFGGKVDNASTIFLDIPGYNYRIEDIETEHAEHPERLVYASETFARDVYDYWALAKRAPYFLGEFVWTAMDYLGEAGLGASAQLDKKGIPYFFPVFPWVNAWCGDIDLIGHQKAPSLCRDVVWGLSPLEMTVQRPVPDGKFEYVAIWGWSDELQSWSWTGAEGKPIAVRVYSSGDRVELWLNGNRLEERALTPADKMRVEFKVPFTPGVLEAIAFMDGKEIGRRKLETVGPPKKLRLTVEPGSARCDRQALMYVGIDVVDDQGRILPDEQRKISLSIDGPAELIGFGSANQLATGSFQASEALTYRGRALAILRSHGNPGTIQIDAQTDGLQRQRVRLRLD
jgi:beta-galactosidase